MEKCKSASKHGGKLLRRWLYYAFLFKQTEGGDDLRYKEDINNVGVGLQCRPMNKTEIKNNNTVNIDQTKGEIIGTKLIYTIKISKY